MIRGPSIHDIASYRRKLRTGGYDIRGVTSDYLTYEMLRGMGLVMIENKQGFAYREFDLAGGDDALFDYCCMLSRPLEHEFRAWHPQVSRDESKGSRAFYFDSITETYEHMGPAMKWLGDNVGYGRFSVPYLDRPIVAFKSKRQMLHFKMVWY